MGERSRYGQLVAALGAVLLAVAVYLPWYGVAFTTIGVSEVQHAGGQLVAQFGNASLQSYLGSFHASLGALAGHELGALSAHQQLSILSVVLPLLAGLALLDALVPLARASSLPDGAGGSLVLIGIVAAICVLYRMISPPAPAGGVLALSLREGAWLALGGALTIVAGGLWPRVPATAGDRGFEAAWSGLSGWTPQS